VTVPEAEISSVAELQQRYAQGDRDFEAAKLSSADLHNAILHGANLSEAILSGAVLTRADLRGVDLSWADLSHADLRGADLRGALLTRADLSHADLSHANLLHADLSLAIVETTNFSEAIMPNGSLHPADNIQADRPLTLYHTPISFNSRRVWIALLEKGLNFTLVEMQLNGDQFAREFIELNPFHHVPVLTEGNFTAIESLAILDYLDAKYPHPALLPTSPEAIAGVRQVQMVTVNELLPTIQPLILHSLSGTEVDPAVHQKIEAKVATILKFLAQQLGDRSYFGGEHLSQADIVAGTVLPWFTSLGLSLAAHPSLQAWVETLSQRPSWQQTQPTTAQVAAFRDRARQFLAAKG